MRRIFKILYQLAIIGALLIGILFIASKLMEQKIVSKAITILNSQLNVPIYVDNISFSLLKKFPNATLQLNNVTILSAKDFNRNHFNRTNVDTLAYAKELFLSINLPALLNNSLNITKAYIHNGEFNLLVDKKGKENYKILDINVTKEQDNTIEGNFEFLLNQIQLKQVNINFVNKYKNTDISISAPTYSINGKIYKKEYTAKTSGELLLNYFEQGKTKIHPELPTNINMDLSINNNIVTILQSNIKAKNYQLSASGDITLGIPAKVNLKIDGNSSKIKGLIGLIYTNNTSELIPSGQLGVTTIIKGYLGGKLTPKIDANFKLINGKIDNENTTILDTIQFEGSFSNGKNHNLNTSSIIINNIFLSYNRSWITAKASILDFTTPNVTISGNIDTYIGDIRNYIPNNGLDYTYGGTINGDFHCSGIFRTKETAFIEQFIDWDKTGEFHISDGNLISEEKKIYIHNVNGELDIQNNSISFNTLNSNIQNSVIKGYIHIENFILPIIDSISTIKINTNINADIINYKDYEYFFNTDNSSTINIHLNGDFKTDKLFFNKVIANSVSGHLNYNNNKLQVSNLNFRTMGGSVSSNINYISKTKSKQVFQTYTSTKNVNIKTLFSTFNNFNQDFITDDNIDGSLTSNFDLEMVFIDGKLKPSSIEFLGYSHIDDGKINNFELINSISKFSEIEEMHNIKFSSFENNILISNGVINIPKTEIKSNAFDISIFGYHKFDGDYEYHMRINLSDFMKGKSNRLAKQQSQFGYIEDDGYGKRTIFLLATSKNGKSKIKLDGTEVRKNLKSNIKEEKHELKRVLHDQFGWFKKDSTLDKPEPKKQEFIIEWDEE